MNMAMASSRVVLSRPRDHKLSVINGTLNKMSKEQLKRQAGELGLHDKGTKNVLLPRLKNYYKRVKDCLPTQADAGAAAVVTSLNEQPVDYFCVVDFEATCWSDVPFMTAESEIIEFPVVLLNARTLKKEAEFHSYCRPTRNPILSEYCRSLTGITQAQVDAADTFPFVLKRFESWLAVHVGRDQTISIATHGPWDLQKFLFDQCKFCEQPFPPYAQHYVNMKRHFSNLYSVNIHDGDLSIAGMLSMLELEFEGQEHSGIDDARNIATIMQQMMRDGYVLRNNREVLLQ